MCVDLLPVNRGDPKHPKRPKIRLFEKLQRHDAKLANKGKMFIKKIIHRISLMQSALLNHQPSQNTVALFIQ